MPALGEPLEPMPLRTDLVSGAECDRVAWLHHAATEAMGQEEGRGTTHRKAAWTTPLTGRLGSSPNAREQFKGVQHANLVRAIIYADHRTKRQ